MSKKANKAIISKTEQILKDFGYNVKTSDLCELFAKLFNEPSWASATTNKVNILQQFTESLKVKASDKNYPPINFSIQVKHDGKMVTYSKKHLWWNPHYKNVIVLDVPKSNCCAEFVIYDNDLFDSCDNSVWVGKVIR
jgi:hypothetical protein